MKSPCRHEKLHVDSGCDEGWCTMYSSRMFADETLVRSVILNPLNDPVEVSMRLAAIVSFIILGQKNLFMAKLRTHPYYVMGDPISPCHVELETNQ